MKKLLKITGIVLVLALAFVLLAILTLPLWIGPVVKPVVNTAVPKVTKTDFRLGELGFNFYNGRVTVGDLHLANPSGYDQKMAFTLKRAFIDVDMSTVASDTLVVEKIEIKDLFVSYLDNDAGVNNIEAILANVKDSLGVADEDGKESEIKKDKGEGWQKPTFEKREKAAEAEEGEEEESPAMKVIIDDITIDGVVVKWGKMTFPMKIPIHITGIGRGALGTSTDGVSPEEAWKEILTQFLQALVNVGVGLKDLGVDLGNMGASGIESVTSSIKGLDSSLKVSENAGSIIKSGTDVVSDGADALKEGAGTAVKATKETFNKATEKATDLFKGLLKK